jgi:uncharacterized protein
MNSPQMVPAGIKKISSEMILALVILVAVSIVLTSLDSGRQALLFLTGAALGFVLYYADFGFTGAFGAFIKERATAGFRAILLMLGVAAVLFFPFLADGNLFGGAVVGNVAPAGISVVVGAFLFGIGMQAGGGCSSGTLAHLGAGSARMAITFLSIILGSLLALSHLHYWRAMPALPPISLIDSFGWFPALALTLIILGAVWIWLSEMEFTRHGRVEPIGLRSDLPLAERIFSRSWTLAYAAIALAFLNFITLFLAGRPWGVITAYGLWGGKTLQTMGFGVEHWNYWSGATERVALQSSFFGDVTSVMNIGIIIGALLTAGVAQKFKIVWKVPRHLVVSSMFGGLLMGYGAHLAYGCNIGAFFSGIASGSLHGWFWILFALGGSYVGVHMRPLFAHLASKEHRADKSCQPVTIPVSPGLVKAIFAGIFIAIFLLAVADSSGQLDRLRPDNKPAAHDNPHFDMNGFGAYLISIDSPLATRFNLPLTSGVFVNNVRSGSYASEIGLSNEDIITHFDNLTVTSVNDVARGFAAHQFGDRINLRVLRNKKWGKNLKFTYREFAVANSNDRVGVLITGHSTNPTIANELNESRFLMIYSMDSGKVDIIENPYRGMGQGRVAKWIVSNHVGSIIVGKIATNDLNHLTRGHVKVYSGVFGTARDAIALYGQGALIAKGPVQPLDYKSVNLIAMPSDYTYPGAPIAFDIEQAQFIVCLELDSNNYKILANPIHDSNGGDALLFVQFLVDNQIDVVIVNKVSSKILVELKKSGIQVRSGVDSSIGDAAMQFQNGTL